MIATTYLEKKWSKRSIYDDVKTKKLKTDALFLSFPTITSYHCVLSDPAQLVRQVEMRLCHKYGLDYQINQGVPERSSRFRA